MPAPAVHVIINPKSGGGNAARHRKEIVRELQARGIDAIVHETAAAGHAVNLAYELALSGARIIAAAGGDGTVHDVANGILRAGASTALGVLAFGTGNDFAKVVPGALKRESAYDALARPHIAPYDVGHVSWQGGEEFFINGMGTGIDIEVVRQILRLPHMPGPLKYLVGLLRALGSYKPVGVTATIDGDRIDRSVMMMAVGNGVCQGGGFYLTPEASPTDGRLELCIVDAIPLWKVPFVLPLVLRGTHTRHPSVTMRAGKHLRFEANSTGSLYFQLDGELRETENGRWIDISIRPGALNVVTGHNTNV